MTKFQSYRYNLFMKNSKYLKTKETWFYLSVETLINSVGRQRARFHSFV